MNLHEQLDDIFEAISPAPAPIEAAMKRGTRIRWRRRVVTATGIAAAVAVAIGVPLTVHWQASPAPANTHYTVTLQPPGPHAPANEIAYGTVNGKAWRILMAKPTPNPSGSYGYCVEALGPAFGMGETEPPTGTCVAPSGATHADPVIFAGPGMWALYPQAIGEAGAVAADVSYVTITLANGTVLTLHPVTVYGSRYVAFAAPDGIAVKATAYSSRGEIATATAFTGTEGLEQFVTWLSPGQRGLPRATGLLASGTMNGQAWSASADLGPWGICARINTSSYCQPARGPLGLHLALIDEIAIHKGQAVEIWTVPSSAVRVVVTVPGAKAFQVRPVTVGVQQFAVFQVTGALSVGPTVMTYDSAGNVVGRSS